MLTSSKTFDFKNQMCITRFIDAITAEYSYHLERIAVTVRKTKTVLHTYCQAEERSTNIFGS
jgi:glycyl-tRNA synthetase alpha subunit